MNQRVDRRGVDGRAGLDVAGSVFAGAGLAGWIVGAVPRRRDTTTGDRW